MKAGRSLGEGVSVASVTPNDGWLLPSLAVIVTLEPLLAVTVTVEVCPAAAPVPDLSINRPYWTLGTMVIESMMGGLIGLLTSPELLASTGTPAMAWRMASPATSLPIMV